MTGALIDLINKVFKVDLTKYIKYEFEHGDAYSIENSPQIKEL
jgi:hypothetical protein